MSRPEYDPLEEETHTAATRVKPTFSPVSVHRTTPNSTGTMRWNVAQLDKRWAASETLNEIASVVRGQARTPNAMRQKLADRIADTMESAAHYLLLINKGPLAKVEITAAHHPIRAIVSALILGFAVGIVIRR
jgi:hypothetical protein